MSQTLSAAWFAQLQPASWRGVPFAVRESSIRRGRKTAVHEYPYRDDVWVEDLGLGTRVISFRGFLIGDDVIAQRDAMVAAAETAGPGVIVHPTLGPRTASVTEFEASESADSGRVIELAFTLIETSQPVYPSTDTSTQSAATGAADTADTSAAGDFGDDVADAIAEGADVVGSVVQTVQGFAAQVLGVAGDASLVLHAVAGLQGFYGRYADGAKAAGTLQPATATVTSVLAAATTAQTAIATAATTAENLAAAL